MSLTNFPDEQPTKTKSISMSFFQRAFDEFWNSYKPIEHIRINYDHDRYADQYSIGEMLSYIKILFHPGALNLYQHGNVRALIKYANEFNNIEILNRFNEISDQARIDFRSVIQKISSINPNDTALQKVYQDVVQKGKETLFDLFAKVVDEDKFLHKSSNKITLFLKDEVAWLYNRNSKNEGVKEVKIKLSDTGVIRIHDININGITFSTLKNVSIPGFSIAVEIETNQVDETNKSPDEISIHIEKGPLNLSKSFNIGELSFTPKITLNVKDSENVNNIYKTPFLDFDPNIKLHIPVNFKLPEWAAAVINGFYKSDYLNLSIGELIQKLANEQARIFINKLINTKIDTVISILLGDIYPIIDIRQIKDEMLITYMPKPEDGSIQKIIPMEFMPDNNLAKFDHIVVVMMENRSFDHMLGYLKVEEGRPDVDGLTGNESNVDSEGKAQKVYHNSDTQINQDPSHTHESVMEQIGSDMDGFVLNFSKKYSGANNRNIWKNVMSYYGKEQVTTYDYLANNFAVCDRWFCSHPGQTLPNRFVSYTGNLNKNENGEPEVENVVFENFTPVETYTIFDYLTKCEISWKVFEHGYSFIRLFTNYTYDITNIINANNPSNGFYALAAKGELPAVTFIEPDYIDIPPGNDDHPPGDILKGQNFLGKVVEALQNSPQWEKTLLVITYDEHGGFYDHVKPPVSAVQLAESVKTYGPRVPAMAASAYIPAKMVSHELFDHTSILATIMRRFIHPDLYPFINLGSRVSTANDLGSLLSLEEPRKPNHNLTTINVEPYRESLLSRSYKTPLPALESNGYHETLLGYRLLLGFPPK